MINIVRKFLIFKYWIKLHYIPTVFLNQAMMILYSTMTSE